MDTGTIRRLPLREGERELQLRPDDYVKLFDFDVSQCGNWLAGVGSAGRVRVWDTASAVEVKSFGVGGWSTFVAFSPDSSKVFTGGRTADFSIYNWQRGVSVINFDR